MGGLNEDTITAPATPKQAVIQDAPAAAPAATSPLGVEQTIRFHEDPTTGQIHFHDDANGLKVGIPVADWFSAWRRIRQVDNRPGGDFTYLYVDTEHKTLLTVRSWLSPHNWPTVDCHLSITRIAVSETIAKLDNLMPRKK